MGRVGLGMQTERYTRQYREFRWNIPPRFNIAEAILERNRGDNIAIIDVSENFDVKSYSFSDLRRLAHRLANIFRHLGVDAGDRIGILLSQSVELVVSHLAAYLTGAIAVPLFTLFGDEAVTYRINDAGCTVLIADGQDWERIRSVRSQWPHVRSVILTGAPSPADDGVISWAQMDKASDEFRMRPTKADDPALIIYTSGTTGSPKGAVHAHRVLLGHMPGVLMSHQGFPQPGDLMWTPADWAWIGGLLDVLLPSLYQGIGVVAFRPRKFDPERGLELMRRFHLRNIFFPPTALRLLRQSIPGPKAYKDVHLRTLASGGEALSPELWDWIRSAFGIVPAEFYGQTEANLLLSNQPDAFPPQIGSMGRPVYGHHLRLLNDRGDEAGVGETGEIMVELPDPVAFLKYWNKTEATDLKTSGGKVHTGDLARRDEWGNFYFVGRADDIINSSGYRMGPTEIEAAILSHPQVAMAAVIGKPDPIRGQIVKAFVVPVSQSLDRDQVTKEVQDLVRKKLGAHEYPREVAFVESLPMTTTGKIQRRILREREKPQP